jgi:Caspase domain
LGWKPPCGFAVSFTRAGEAEVDGARSALIVANDRYTDPGLRRLRAPGRDAQALARVLRDPGIGDFEVRVLLNEPAHEVNLAVEEFFADRRPDDLLLVHFSCHGVKDESGELFFAAANTRLRRLGATAVAAEFVNRRMSRSRSRRVVLLLDCCYAGAFERGMTARAGTGIGIGEQFGGRGRAVITASSAMEYAFEGDELADTREQAPSVFTSALVEGLEIGEADRDQDGLVALDELYDYVYDKVRAVTPHQTPGKWTFGVQGELVIARRSRPVTTPVPLPPELQEAVDSPFAGVRAGVVPELARLLRNRHAGLALAARLTLERLTQDDSRATSAAATAALQAQPPPPTTPPEPQDAGASFVELPGAPSATARARVPAAPSVRSPAAADPAPGTRDPAGATVGDPVAGRRDVAAGPTPPPGDLGLRGAGWVAVGCAVLLALGLLMGFQWDEVLADVLPSEALYVVIVAAVVLGAGACLLVPGTRWLAGAGLLLGVAAASTKGLVTLVTYAAEFGGGLGNGYRVELVAHLLLVVAACLAVVALVRSGRYRLVIGVPRHGRSRLVVLLGAAGSLALLLHVLRLSEIEPKAYWIAPSVWLTVVALVVPAVAAVATPRRFGAFLLAGWVGGAAALFAAYLAFADEKLGNDGLDIGRTPILLFGVTLVALLVVAVLEARAEPVPATG